MVSSRNVIEPADHASTSSTAPAVKCVNINLIPGGVEIIAICSGSSLLLSDLMEIILEEGCDVVGCVSTQVNGRIFHTIKSQVPTYLVLLYPCLLI